MSVVRMCQSVEQPMDGSSECAKHEGLVTRRSCSGT